MTTVNQDFLREQLERCLPDMPYVRKSDLLDLGLLSSSVLYRLMVEGEIPFIRITPGTARFPREALIDFLVNRSSGQ